MIYLRLDERLLHGQVTSTWVGFYHITNIIIANEKSANDELQSKLLKMAAPKGIKMAICGLDKATSLLNDDRCDSLNILVICSKLEDVLYLVKNAKKIKDVNLGNYGFLSNRDAKNKKMLTTNLCVDEEEYKIVEQLLAMDDIDCYCQVIASQNRKSINL